MDANKQLSEQCTDSVKSVCQHLLPIQCSFCQTKHSWDALILVLNISSVNAFTPGWSGSWWLQSLSCELCMWDGNTPLIKHSFTLHHVHTFFHSLTPTGVNLQLLIYQPVHFGGGQNLLGHSRTSKSYTGNKIEPWIKQRTLKPGGSSATPCIAPLCRHLMGYNWVELCYIILTFIRGSWKHLDTLLKWNHAFNSEHNFRNRHQTNKQHLELIMVLYKSASVIIN